MAVVAIVVHVVAVVVVVVVVVAIKILWEQTFTPHADLHANLFLVAEDVTAAASTFYISIA